MRQTVEPTGSNKLIHHPVMRASSASIRWRVTKSRTVSPEGPYRPILPSCWTGCPFLSRVLKNASRSIPRSCVSQETPSKSYTCNHPAACPLSPGLPIASSLRSVRSVELIRKTRMPVSSRVKMPVERRVLDQYVKKFCSSAGRILNRRKMSRSGPPPRGLHLSNGVPKTCSPASLWSFTLWGTGVTPGGPESWDVCSDWQQ